MKQLAQITLTQRHRHVALSHANELQANNKVPASSAARAELR